MPDDIMSPAAPEPTPEAPVAPAPPAEDWQAKAAAAEARAQAAEAARVQAERDSQERLAQVAYAVSQMNQAPTAPEGPAEDENEFLTRGQLKTKMAEYQRQFAEAAQNTVTEETGASYKHMRALNRNFAQADPSLKYYGKYKDEIEGMIDRLPPKQAAHPDAYKGVYQFVLTKHFDEVMDAEFNARQAKAQTEQMDEYGDPIPPPSRPEAPMPRGDGGRQAISAPGRARPAKLDDWDRFAAQRYYGGDTNKLLQAKERATKEVDTADLLGLKG